MVVNILLVLSILFSLPRRANCEDGHSQLYEKTNGAYLQAEAFCRMSVADQLYCIKHCGEMDNCQFVNVLRNDIGPGFICELLNCSIDFQSSMIKKSENDSFYSLSDAIKGSDCLEVQNAGGVLSGIYPLTSFNSHSKCSAYCDMRTENGGWTVIQRRFDGSISFDRTWNEYKNGFGTMNGEFWFGLDAFHELMQNGNMILRFDMWYGEEHAYMEYYEATIGDESSNYVIDWVGFSGNAGDSMNPTSPAHAIAKGQPFTTYDKDNDNSLPNNCAAQYGGGWWHNGCFGANLNGDYNKLMGHGIVWVSFKGLDTPLSKSEIKIKRGIRDDSTVSGP